MVSSGVSVPIYMRGYNTNMHIWGSFMGYSTVFIDMYIYIFIIYGILFQSVAEDVDDDFVTVISLN